MSLRKRIAVFRTGSLGDTVCAIPAFRMIRREFPSSELILLTDAGGSGNVAASDVVRSLGIFDRVFAYRARAGALTLTSLVTKLALMRPETIILLPQGRETAAAVRRKAQFFRWCGVREVHARAHREWNNGSLPGEADRLVELLRLYGINGAKPNYNIRLDQRILERFVVTAAQRGVDLHRPFVVFCGGGKAATQRWPLERYAQVLRALHDRTGIGVVAIGSPPEVAAYMSEILPSFSELAVLTPLDISELFPLFHLSLGYVGNDTGPMHVAAAFNKPVVAIISGRNARGEWDPDTRERLIFRRDLACGNCFLHECVKHEHQCMLDISAGEVVPPVVEFFLRSLPPYKHSC